MTSAKAWVESMREEITAKRYQTLMGILNLFGRSCGSRKYAVDEVDAVAVDRFRRFVKDRGAADSSCEMYVRSLRMLFSKVAPDMANPFAGRSVAAKRETAPAVVPLDVLRRLNGLSLNDEPDLALARDVFMLSFFTRGMTLYQMASMQWGDAGRQTVVYSEAPGGEAVDFRPMPEALEILRRQRSASLYILPLFSGKSKLALADQLDHRSRLLRQGLKELSRRLGVGPLSLQAARETWEYYVSQFDYEDPLV